MNKKTLAALVASAACLAPGLASADYCLGPGQWMARLGVHNIDPVGGTSATAAGDVSVKSKITPTVNLDYRFCKYFAVDVLGAAPTTQDISIGPKGGTRTQLGSTRHLPPTVSLQYHPLGFGFVDPFVGVGVNRTFFFNEALNGPLAGNNLQLSNTWGYALQGGVDVKLGGPWLVGADVRYIDIEPNASVNGTPIGKVKIDPLAYGVTVGYQF